MKNKRRVRDLFFILVILLALAGIFTYLISSKFSGQIIVGGCIPLTFSPEPGGNVTVEGSCVVFQENLTLPQNVTIFIENGGVLFLQESNLTFNLSEGGAGGIIVESGGRINITDTTIGITNDSRGGFFFISQEGANFSLARSNISGAGWDMGENETGLTLYSDESLIGENRFVNSSIGLTLFYSSNSVIDSNYFEGSLTGISANNLSNLTITNNNFSSDLFTGISIIETENITIENNSFIGNSSEELFFNSLIGISTYNSINLKLTNNYFEKYWIGMGLIFSNNSKFDSNEFFNVTAAASFMYCRDVNFTNNSINETSNETMALNLLGVQNSIFDENNISNGFLGVLLEDSPNNTLRGNIFQNHTNYSIYALGADNLNLSSIYETLYFGVKEKVFVTDAQNEKIRGANVRAIDKNNITRDTKNTLLYYPENDTFALLILPLYIENSSGITYYNNYTFNASYSGVYNSITRNITDLRTLTINLNIEICGNNHCGSTENCTTCEEDCGECPFCGDDHCNGNENCTTCPGDCGNCTVCGDDVCEGSETRTNCPADCTPIINNNPTIYCGDGTCNTNESCSTCSRDCGNCTRCGDSVCNGTETCTSCTRDCGACPTNCGDGTCNGNETLATCPTDCTVAGNNGNNNLIEDDKIDTTFWIILGSIFLFGILGISFLIYYLINRGKKIPQHLTSTPSHLSARLPGEQGPQNYHPVAHQQTNAQPHTPPKKQNPSNNSHIPDPLKKKPIIHRYPLYTPRPRRPPHNPPSRGPPQDRRFPPRR